MPRAAAGAIWIFFLIPASLVLAKPDAVPQFNVQPSCQGARSFLGNDQALAYQGCLKDEADARAELAKRWPKFRPEDRRDCVAQGAEPMPSYVEILTCLEMSEQARELYNPDGTARTTKPAPPKPGLPSSDGTAPAPATPNPAPEALTPAPSLSPDSDHPNP